MVIYDTNGKIVLDVTVDDNSYRNRAIMGDNTLTLHYSLAEHAEIPVGAYCVFQGDKYTLMRPESLKMKHSRYFEYTVIMEAEGAKAKMWKFRNTVDGRLRFPLTAKPHEHLQMFVDNMNKRDRGWEIGQCIDGVETLINYDHAFCYEALGQMASEFKTEFEIDGKTVSLHKVENNKSAPLPLSYGRGNGFKPNVGRSNYGDNAPIEILYVQGGTDNIDRSKYGASELLLPKSQQLQYDGQFFEGEKGFSKEAARTYQSDEAGLSIKRADKPLASYSEDSLDCTDIYPKRKGSVSQVIVVDKEKNFYDIVDSSIPPNLNYEEYLIEGETMTIRFQSGMLAGREFDVKYIHNPKTINGVEKAGRRFEIIPQEVDGQVMPNATFAPQKDDSYAIFNCYLPDSYICDNETKTGASWDMFRAAVKYLWDNEDVKFTFTGELDGIWSKKNWENVGGRLKLGGFIKFSDERFQKEGVLVRITGIKDYINNPHSPVLTLSNSTVTSGFSTTIKELQSEDVLIEELHRSAIQFTKRRFRDAKETMSMLEAAMLENFSNSINPITVQTMSMLVGDESLQFRFIRSLDDSTQVPDSIQYDAVKRVLKSDVSVIQHLTLGINSISSTHTDYKTWELPAFESGILTEGDKKYYLYAKCSDSNQSGEFILSEKAIKIDGVTGFYHLLTGILNSEYNEERSFVPLYGFTEVLPGRITTDKIVSADGKTYFDLANAEIGGRIVFPSSDGSLKTLDELGLDNTQTTIDGGIVTSGTIEVAGNKTDVLAGITGQGTSPDSVRFWAGVPFKERDKAPFRVLQSGATILSKLHAIGAEISNRQDDSMTVMKIIGNHIIGKTNNETDLIISNEYNSGMSLLENGKISVPTNIDLNTGFSPPITDDFVVKSSIEEVILEYHDCVLVDFPVGYIPATAKLSLTSNPISQWVYPFWYPIEDGLSEYNPDMLYKANYIMDGLELWLYIDGTKYTKLAHISETMRGTSQLQNKGRESRTLQKDATEIFIKEGGIVSIKLVCPKLNVSVDGDIYNRTDQWLNTFVNAVSYPVDTGDFVKNPYLVASVYELNIAYIPPVWNSEFIGFALFRNGFMYKLSNEHIAKFTEDEFEVRVGLYAMRISKEGIQKSSNGGTTWVSL